MNTLKQGHKQKEREPFRQTLLELNDRFYDSLLTKYTKKTARKHAGSSESEIKTAVKKFFTYLKENENITNEVILKSL